MSKFVRSRTALITGAASGIGYELAKLFASDNCDLVLVDKDQVGLARVAQELSRTYGISSYTLVKDLSSKHAPLEIYEELTSEGLELDVLVNNAGYGLSGEFREINLEDQLNMIQVNISAVVALTGYLLPQLLKRDSAAILNVASIAAFQAGPYMSTYFASKAFVLSFSEALAQELAGTTVSVTSVCPPPTNTGFAARAGAQGSFAFNQHFMMSVKDVAKEAYDGLKVKRVIVLPGATTKLAVMLSRFIPRSVPISIAGFVNKRRHGAVPESALETPLLRQSS